MEIVQVFYSLMRMPFAVHRRIQRHARTDWTRMVLWFLVL